MTKLSCTELRLLTMLLESEVHCQSSIWKTRSEELRVLQINISEHWKMYCQDKNFTLHLQVATWKSHCNHYGSSGSWTGLLEQLPRLHWEIGSKEQCENCTRDRENSSKTSGHHVPSLKLSVTNVTYIFKLNQCICVLTWIWQIQYFYK